ncbi:MAG TPA: phosphatase PAP2 family protein [Dysgonamonadaceae bacterium]|nr:phosphatase PAP2 family protein [Dysgonamonadaceae bacterium]HOT64844.1 phosphatase PAP2 family protein [Dysgonamonadaceae bacterium]HOV36040.1 phosphatase PAP2 family protein [Dysgonamonadaceae bacterium]HQG07442.1 phosphatase PAP2 family protein [Dysgonamonadaceae bacterium]HQI42905.1 phosphatase PAP2 family protein [Dysgonamonadaceae bacterium]
MNELIDRFLPLERDLFFALNGSDSPFLDNLMWTYTRPIVWLPLFLFLIFMMFYKTPYKEAILTLVLFLLVFGISDFVSSSIFKPLFHRFRPTHYPGFEQYIDIVRNYRGGMYGFVSGHACTSFGIATFISLLFRNKWVTITSILWASINSYSRIYLGVHFISDIVFGAIVGVLIAFLFFELYKWVRLKCFHVELSKPLQSVYNEQSAKIISICIPCYILLIVALSPFLYR